MHKEDLTAGESGGSCGGVCGTEEEKINTRREFALLGTGAVIYFIALLFSLPPLFELSLFLISYVIVGGEIIWRAVKNLFHGKVFDENFLLTVATVGAFAITEYPEAVAVMLFFRVGELLQEMALDRSRRSIRSLMEMRPDYANLKVDGRIKRVAPSVVDVDDVMVIKPGEKVPLDGVVLEGLSLIHI